MQFRNSIFLAFCLQSITKENTEVKLNVVNAAKLYILTTNWMILKESITTTCQLSSFL